MQILYKITIVLLILVILLNTCSNIVYAEEKENVTVQSIGKIVKHLKYKEENTQEYKYYETDFEGYVGSDGKKYPVYSVENPQVSVTQQPYYAVIEDNIKNTQIENIIQNGYLYKSAKEWNLEDEKDLYVVTKLAIECILGKIKIEELYAEEDDNEAVAMLEALKKIINIGANATSFQRENNISIKKVGELKDKKEYYVQAYQVTIPDECKLYEISTNNKLPEGVFISNQKGKEQTVFNKNENFNIIIPKIQLEKDLNMDFTINSKYEINEVRSGRKTNNNEEIYVVMQKKSITLSEELKLSEKARVQEKEEVEDKGAEKEEIKKVQENPVKKEEKIIQGKIKIITKSRDYNKITKDKKGKALEGAKFEIYNENNEKITLIVTNKNGVAITSKLKEGKYKIKQISTEKGYYINTNTVSVEIKKNNDIVQVNIENESKNPEIKIEQSGLDKAEIGKEAEYDISIKNEGNTEVNNLIFQYELSSKNITVTKFRTGSYNQDLSYNVYYKTNISNNEYILLMEDLNSKENYEIDFSKEIADNEHLTSIKLDFGTVDIGFCSNENPHINAIINKEVKSETTFNCNASLSGKYEGYKLQDVSKWKTFAYKLLPKTGG